MSQPQAASKILSFAEARRCVEEHAARLPKPDVTTNELSSLGLIPWVLAEDIVADRDFPPFDRSTRDGYAVRSADVSVVPSKMKLAGQIKAGESYNADLKPGECVEIMTGAPVPKGADAVVMVEFTETTGDLVEVHRSVSGGENIVKRGSEAKAGKILLKAGTRLNHAGLAIAASVGKLQLSVYRQPRVAILATGDEIGAASTKEIGPFQIRNSNSFSLASQAMSAGAVIESTALVADELNTLRQAIEAGLHADLLILSGGVSMGKYDLVEQVLADLGAEFYFTGAKIQPGKPVVFGKVKGKYFFGLPGNPVSTMVTFELFVRPMIEALGGAKPSPLRFAQAALKREFRTKPGLTRFLPAILSGGYEGPEVELVAWQGSGDIAAMSKANCYLLVPDDKELLGAGQPVSVLLP